MCIPLSALIAPSKSAAAAFVPFAQSCAPARAMLEEHPPEDGPKKRARTTASAGPIEFGGGPAHASVGKEPDLSVSLSADEFGDLAEFPEFSDAAVCDMVFAPENPAPSAVQVTSTSDLDYNTVRRTCMALQEYARLMPDSARKGVSLGTVRTTPVGDFCIKDKRGYCVTTPGKKTGRSSKVGTFLVPKECNPELEHQQECMEMVRRGAPLCGLDGVTLFHRSVPAHPLTMDSAPFHHDPPHDQLMGMTPCGNGKTTLVFFLRCSAPIKSAILAHCNSPSVRMTEMEAVTWASRIKRHPSALPVVCYIVQTSKGTRLGMTDIATGKVAQEKSRAAKFRNTLFEAPEGTAMIQLVSGMLALVDMTSAVLVYGLSRANVGKAVPAVRVWHRRPEPLQVFAPEQTAMCALGGAAAALAIYTDGQTLVTLYVQTEKVEPVPITLEVPGLDHVAFASIPWAKDGKLASIAVAVLPEGASEARRVMLFMCIVSGPECAVLKIDGGKGRTTTLRDVTQAILPRVAPPAHAAASRRLVMAPIAPSDWRNRKGPLVMQRDDYTEVRTCLETFYTGPGGEHVATQCGTVACVLQM